MKTTPAIKVLHLIPTLSSGGAERQIVNLVSSTNKEIVNHTVCVIGEAEFFESDVRKAGCEVVKLGIYSKHPFLQAAIKFRKVVDKLQPDIIHSWLYDANIAARLATFFRPKIPLVTSFQLPDYEPEFAAAAGWNPYKVRGLKAIDKLSAVTTKPYFVPCSEFVKKSFERHYGIDETKTNVIYNSVNPELLNGANGGNLRREFNLPSDAFIYLNVGRLDPQKNQKTLLQAFQEVSLEIPNAVLLLVGIGRLENELKEMINNLSLDSRVLFLGKRNDVAALLELSDVFVFPSLFEGLGVALIEAMFKSLPCIASNTEVFREVVEDGETGLLVNPASPADLANAMISLYTNEDLRKSLGANALRQASTKFHASITARQWERFYQKVAL